MQSAMNALNPVKSIGAQFTDALRAHGVTRSDITARSAEVLRLVGIDAVHLGSYPHQLSGGMRQRAMIAMALLFTPDLVIMDEPTSALDVVAQRSLMVQIKELQRELGFAVIFVTHDMSLVSSLLRPAGGDVRRAGGRRLGPTRRYSTARCTRTRRGLLDAFPSIRGARVPLDGDPRRPARPRRHAERVPVRPSVPRGVRRRARPRAARCTTRTARCVRCLLYDDAAWRASAAHRRTAGPANDPRP